MWGCFYGKVNELYESFFFYSKHVLQLKLKYIYYVTSTEPNKHYVIYVIKNVSAIEGSESRIHFISLGSETTSNVTF